MARKDLQGEYNPAHNIVKKSIMKYLKIFSPTKNLWYLFVKRAADIICSLLALIFFITFIFGGFYCNQKDGGPVFYAAKNW